MDDLRKDLKDMITQMTLNQNKGNFHREEKPRHRKEEEPRHRRRRILDSRNQTKGWYNPHHNEDYYQLPQEIIIDPYMNLSIEIQW